MASSAERHDLLFAAKLSEQAKRYDEMGDAMKKLVMMKVELSPEERSAFSMAYKKAIEPLRSSWGILQQGKSNEEINGAKQKVIRIREFQEKIESDLSSICEEVMSLLDKHLLPFTTNDENRVFYLKMKGDYYRYMAEYKTESEKKKAISNSLKAYQTAIVEAEGLPPLNPIMLGSNLNYSVFLYDIVKARRRAMAVARRTVDAAVGEIEGKMLNKEVYEDSMTILDLIKDNLARWAADVPLGSDDLFFVLRRFSL
ncbi:14-3-3 protein 8 [Vitis vinifera]|uniref:14-3-3 protein 8 n=1 Tax=Vitis vinifera TaxID=29760 RepID=A0A438GBK8_VITVI|nr:14-3-3 protein 8 [Vitis vinifera]